MLDANPDFSYIQGDIKNGHNEVSRASVLDGIRSHASISNTLVFSHAMMEPVIDVGMEGVTGLVWALFNDMVGAFSCEISTSFNLFSKIVGKRVHFAHFFSTISSRMTGRQTKHLRVRTFNCPKNDVPVNDGSINSLPTTCMSQQNRLRGSFNDAPLERPTEPESARRTPTG